MGDSGAGDLPAQELSAELKVNLPVEQVEKLKRAVELAKELVKQQKEHNKAVQESNDLANKSQQAGGGSRGMIPHGGGPGGPGGGYGSSGGPGSSALTIYGGQGMRPGNDSSNWLYEQMKAEFVRWVQNKYGGADWSVRGELGGRGAPKLLGSNEFTGRPMQDGWRDLGERTTYGSPEDKQIAKDAISGVAKSSKMAIAARIGGYVTYAAKIALDEMEARNKADIVLQQGGSGGDASRASMGSNFFSRQLLSAYDTITNREGKLYEVQLASQRAEIARQGRQEERDLSLQFGSQRRRLGAEISAIDQIPNVVQSPFFNTMTLAGRTQSEEFQRRAPIMARDFDLQRQQRGIELERAGMMKQYNQFVQENRRGVGGDRGRQAQAGLAAGRAGEDADGMLGMVDSPEQAAKKLKFLDEQIRLGKDINKTVERQRDLLKEIVEKDKEGVRVNADRARLKADFLRADAAMFNQRADEAEGQSLRIGGMSPLQRNLALNALKTFMNSANPDMLPNEIINMASGIAPKTVQERQMQLGAKTPEMMELRRIAPNEFKGDAEELRRKAIEAENKIPEVNLRIDRQRLVQELQVAWNPQIEQAFKELLQENNRQQMVLMEANLKRMAMQIKNGGG